MSKKDYIALAEAIQEAKAKAAAFTVPENRIVADAAIAQTAQEIARVCARDNGRFDRDRFLRAALQGEFHRARGITGRGVRG